MSALCGLVGNIAGVEISQGFTQFRGWADDSFKATQETIEYLSEFLASDALQPVPITVDFNIPAGLGDPFTRPDRPVAPDTEFAPVNVPQAPNIQTVSPPTMPVPPEDTLQPPGIDEPTPPVPYVPSYANAPQVTDPTFPDVPEYILPDVPVLQDIVLPDVPVIDLPTFTAEPPVINFSAPSNVIDDFNEMYQPVMADEVADVINQMLQGSIGIPQSVWDQIWDRAKQQVEIQGQRDVEQAMNEWASRGFTLPPGVVDLRVERARQNTSNQSSELLRTQVIEENKILIENFRFAVAQGIALDTMLGQLHANEYNRLLAIQTLAVQAALNTFQSQVALFNAQTNLYETESRVYVAELEGQRVILELYKTELEGQLAIGQLNEQAVRIYTEQVNALQANIDLYEAQLKAVQTQVDVDRARIDSYSATIQAEATKVQAKTAEWEGYSAAWDGQRAKASVFNSEAQAYLARAQAYSSEVQGLLGVNRANIDAEQLKLQSFASQLAQVNTFYEAESRRIAGTAQIFQGQSRLYTADGAVESSRVQADTAQYNATVAKSQIDAQLQLEKARTNIAQLQRLLALELDGIQTIATVQSQLTASSLSAVNLSAQVTERAVNSSSCSESYSGEI